jgi:integrase
VVDRRNAKAAAVAKADVPTFGTMADAYLKAHEAGWRNPKHRQQWAMTLREYCRDIRNVPVNQIDAKAILRVLTPIWTATPETASRLRGRIEVILASAQVAGWIDADRANPARWRNWLDHMLAAPKKLGSRGHHRAMDYRDLPAFMARLKETPGTASLALAFTVLTACRTSEVVNAVWGEISFADAVWRVPGSRMKMGQPHDTPLSEQALRILGDARAIARKPPTGDSFVFPGGRPRMPLSSMAMAMLLRRMDVTDATVHGMRSAARSWMADTGVAFELAESALAHTTGGVVAAYQRSSLLERRRPIMSAWARYVCGEADDRVVSIRRTRGPQRAK